MLQSTSYINTRKKVNKVDFKTIGLLVNLLNVNFKLI